MIRDAVQHKSSKNFVTLMAIAMFVSIWLLPTFLWQFGFLKEML